MASPRDRMHRPRSDPRFSRRSTLRALAGGGMLLGLGACGDDGDEGVDQDVGALEPTVPDAEIAPTATQGPIDSPVPGYQNPERWRGRTLVVATPGGAYQEAQAEAFFEPFARLTGVEVLVETVVLDQLIGQVEEGVVTWDVADIPTDEVLPLAEAGYLAPINYDVVDASPLFPEIVMPHAVGAAFFSTLLVYPLTLPRVPSGWDDFWNVVVFDGARALKRTPVGTLEFALLADGVEMDELYPLDVGRAFAMLDRIRDHVIAWYEDGKQPVELVAATEVTMASAWNVRAQIPEVADLLGLQWHGGMLSAESWVVPAGAPNEDVAMDFINFATRAIPTANFSRLLPFGPVNTDAFALLRPDLQEILPTAPENYAVQFVEGWEWWAENREAVDELFTEWLLAEPLPDLEAPDAEE